MRDVRQPEFAAAVREWLGKQRVSILLDGEIIAFFKAKGGGMQQSDLDQWSCVKDNALGAVLSPGHADLIQRTLG
jgi:hypothetical protein